MGNQKNTHEADPLIVASN